MKEFSIAIGGKINAYKLFWALALRTLTSTNGIACFIFQNSFLADKQAINLRKYTLTETQILSIDSYPERDNKKKRVFEDAKMSVCIPIVRVTPAKTSFVVNYWDDRQKTSGISTTLSLEDIIAIDPEYYSIPRLSASCKPVIYKMLKHKSIKVTCYEGELNVTSHRQFFTSNTEDPVILKGASIQRYYYTYKMSQGHIEHLNENHYLKQCGQSNKSHHHDKERIVMQGMTGANDKIRLVMTIVPKGIYLGHSCKYILLPPNIDIHFALGFYNSKLANWFFKCFSTNSNVNGYEIESIPFPAVYNNEQEQIANIVKNIISVKKLDCNADTSTMEYQIDKLIYEIFNLSKDDIAIVEGK